jgi:hypothetical protein
MMRGKKYYKIQLELWEKYIEFVEELSPVDVLAVNADCTDGRGDRSGSLELIHLDRKVQVNMAVDCINVWNAPKIIMTRGTPYHVGNVEEWEDMIAEKVGAVKIGDHEWFDVNGVVFDMKHHVGASSIPHGEFTAIAKDRLWNYLWSEHEEQPRADILIRSHVHYHAFCGNGDWLAMTTPALQGQGSKFGARRCSRVIHWGLVYFDVFDDGSYHWEPRIVHAESQKITPTKL